MILTRGIRVADGVTGPGSYVWSFTVMVDDGSGSFVRVRDIGVGSIKSHNGGGKWRC